LLHVTNPVYNLPSGSSSGDRSGGDRASLAIMHWSCSSRPRSVLPVPNRNGHQPHQHQSKRPGLRNGTQRHRPNHANLAVRHEAGSAGGRVNGVDRKISKVGEQIICSADLASADKIIRGQASYGGGAVGWIHRVEHFGNCEGNSFRDVKLAAVAHHGRVVGPSGEVHGIDRRNASCRNQRSGSGGRVDRIQIVGSVSKRVKRSVRQSREGVRTAPKPVLPTSVSAPVDGSMLTRLPEELSPYTGRSNPKPARSKELALLQSLKRRPQQDSSCQIRPCPKSCPQ
jgi:hypothetical protein